MRKENKRIGLYLYLTKEAKWVHVETSTDTNLKRLLYETYVLLKQEGIETELEKPGTLVGLYRKRDLLDLDISISSLKLENGAALSVY